MNKVDRKESSITAGIMSCYGELSSHIHGIVSQQPLSIFYCEQGE